MVNYIIIFFTTIKQQFVLVKKIRYMASKGLKNRTKNNPGVPVIPDHWTLCIKKQCDVYFLIKRTSVRLELEFTYDMPSGIHVMTMVLTNCF